MQRFILLLTFVFLAPTPYSKEHRSTAEASGRSAAKVKVCWSRRRPKLNIGLYTRLLRIKKVSAKRKERPW